MTKDAAPPPPEGSEEQPERQTTPFLVLQFFVFPMAVVAACVAVFVIFGLVAGESRGASGYLDDVRTGGANRRWQAAFELAKELQAGKDPVLKDPRFAARLLDTFEQAKNDDPRVRRYLALALGRLGSPSAVPALLAAAATPAEGEADTETRIYSIWALGALADPAAVPALVALARDEDAGLRKTALHALGAFPTEESREVLVLGLDDAVEDVRWNAALGLARQKDARAASVLLQMLDRDHLARVEGLRPDQTREALLQAIAGAASLGDSSLRPALENLRAGDPDLRVREAARLALGSEPAAGGAGLRADPPTKCDPQ
jgi:HEAT repeat protein